MSSNPIYHRIMSNRRWITLRAYKLAKTPLCERCTKEGRTRLAKEVHHIIPVETEKSEARMRALAYDYNNLMSLCESCHHDIHKESGRFQTKAQIKESTDRKVKGFMEDWL